MQSDFLSIGKIINFHGIKGEAKVGYSNKSVISWLKFCYIDKQYEKIKLEVSSIRFHKNFAIIKFKEINSINELLEFKGKNIYLLKEEIEKRLDKNEFLIEDLIGMKVFDNNEDYIGEVVEIKETLANEILCIKPEDDIKEIIMVPFVKEIVPGVDIQTGQIIIKPIEVL